MLFEARSHYDHEGVAVNRLSSLCLALRLFLLACNLSPLWRALPLLIYVEGAGYMWSPIRIRTSLPSNTNRIQVRVFLVK